MGIVLAFLSGLSFACGNIVAKKALDRSNFRYSIWITACVNCVLFGLIVWVNRTVVVAEEPVPITWTGTFFFLVAGCLTTFLGRKTLYKSFERIGPSKGSAIKNSSPIFTLLVAFLVIQESISFYAGVGIVIVLVGILLQGVDLFQMNGKPAAMKASVPGYLFAVSSAVLFGVGLAVRAPGMDEIPDPYYGALMGAIVSLFFATCEELHRSGVRSFSSFLKNCLKPENRLFYLAGICTSAGVGTFFMAIKTVEVSIVATVAAIEPLLTIVLSIIILRKTEIITRLTVVSAVVVILGVAFIAWG